MPIGIDMNNYDISMGTGQIRMSGGGTFTSDNSINYDWILRASPADYVWFSITYGAGLFVAMAYDGSNNSVMTSPDGINWTLRTTPGQGWRSVVYGNGIFVAVGDGGSSRIMTSTNGITWTASNQFTSGTYLYVAYGLVNGTTPTFVAVGHTGTNRIIYSTNNGTTWQGITTYDTIAFFSCAFGNGRFVALSNTAPYALYSSNGISWSQTNLFQVGHDWNGATYGNGLFVAVSGASGGNGTGGQQLTSRVATSTDGITWTNRYAPDNVALTGVAYGGGIFVALGNGGTGNRTITSTDGITWTSRPSANDSVGWRQIAYGNGIFVAVASSGSGSGTKVMTLDPAYGMSINKITTEETTTNLVKFGQNGATISANPSKNFAWVARSAANTVNYRAICYGNGLFVAAGWNNTNNIMTSTDGYNWIERVQNIDTYNVTCVCYGELSANNMYVIMSNNFNEALTSTNGINWVSTPSIGSNFWGGVCFGYDTSRNGLFVAVTYNGSTNSVATSSNGINWTLRTAVANTWRSVCYGYDTSGNGLFVAVSTSGTNRVMYSYNGITWTGVASANESAEWVSVCYGNGLFVAVANVGTGNRVMTSSNGITWTSRTAVSYSWRSVCYGNGLFTAVADVGFGQNAMTSSDGINWTLRTTPFDISYAAVTYGNGTFVAVAEYASITNKVMTNDYTANDNMLVLNGGISPSSGQLNVKSRLFVGPDGIYSGLINEWATTIMANTEGKVVLSTAPNGGLTGVNGFQANAPFTIFDKFYSTWGSGLNIGLFRDTGAAYIQCQAANTGARNICLQPYSGSVGIGTTAPAGTLHIGSDTPTSTDYRLYIDQGRGINKGININNSNYGSSQSLDIHMVNAGSINFNSYAKIQGKTSGVAGTTHIAIQPDGGSVGIGTTTPARTLDVNGSISGGGLLMSGSSILSTDSTSLFLRAYGNGSNGNAVYLGVNSTNYYFANANAFAPEVDNARTLGASNARWTTVYAVTGTINTSDIREKTDITPTNLGLQFIKKLNPVSYKWKVGENRIDSSGNIIPRPGMRTFYGLLAQEVKQTVDELGTGDFGGWILGDVNDPESSQGLRYTEFICPLIKAVQEQQETIESQKSIIESLQKQLQTFEQRLSALETK
jgi:hypothetical protein